MILEFATIALIMIAEWMMLLIPLGAIYVFLVFVLKGARRL